MTVKKKRSRRTWGSYIGKREGKREGKNKKWFGCSQQQALERWYCNGLLQPPHEKNVQPVVICLEGSWRHPSPATVKTLQIVHLFSVERHTIQSQEAYEGNPPQVSPSVSSKRRRSDHKAICPCCRGPWSKVPLQLIAPATVPDPEEEGGGEI